MYNEAVSVRYRDFALLQYNSHLMDWINENGQ
jgi:hypothetical protein